VRQALIDDVVKEIHWANLKQSTWVRI
jgi:hypothetical protein